MIFAFRNVTTGKTTLIRATDWRDANSALGFMLCENEPLGCIAPVLSSMARHMRFPNKEAFKAWRAEAWKLVVKYDARATKA